MVDSDGSVDDPDAPNQITEGSRRQPFYTFCFRFVLNAHNPRKLMPSVSSTNGQQDHIPSRARGRMVMWEGMVCGGLTSEGGWPERTNHDDDNDDGDDAGDDNGDDVGGLRRDR